MQCGVSAFSTYVCLYMQSICNTLLDTAEVKVQLCGGVGTAACGSPLFSLSISVIKNIRFSISFSCEKLKN